MVERASPDTGRPGRLRGSELTFSVLARSQAEGVTELLTGALSEPDPEIQTGAVRALMARQDRRGLTAVVESFHILSPQPSTFAVEHVDDLLPILRELLSAGSPQVRANVVEMVSRRAQVKLAYLLVRALEDPEERIARKALGGLAAVTHRYHQQAEAARAGLLDLSRSELEAKKFALIDPLLAALTPIGPECPDELLELTMGLDGRTDDLIYRILISPHDVRSRQVSRILETSSAGEVVSFIVGMLRDERKRLRGLTILERRGDPDFVRALLGTERLFRQPVLRDALGGLTGLRWLEDYVAHLGWESGPVGQDAALEAVLTEPVNFIRTVELAVLSGLSRPTKEAILETLSRRGPNEFVRRTAVATLEALSAGRPTETISMALWDTERTVRAQQETRAAENMSWARPGAAEIPADAFRRFFEGFDRLDPEVRSLAAITLTRLDPELDGRLRQVLASLEPGRRLQAVKIVQALHREPELQSVLLELVQDPDQRVRATVVKTLAILGDEPAVRALLGAVADFDRRVVANTVEAIEAVGFAELVGLLKIFTQHPNNRIRANAVKALLLMGNRSAEGVLRQMLASPQELMRLSATWVLGEIDHPQRLDWLERLTRTDASARVRQKARAVLGEIT